MRKVLISVCILLDLVYLGYSQNNSYGLSGSINNNNHSGNFQKLPGFPNCCPNFERGNGWGFSVGGEFSSLVTPRIFLSPRLGYISLSGKFRRPETTYFIINGEAIQGEFEHRLDADLKGLFIEPMITFKPLKYLFISAGMNSTFLVKYSFHQEERLTKPSNGVTFLDSNGNDTHSRLRNVFDGTIPNVQKLQLFVLGRVGAEFPLSRDWKYTITPEISFSVPLLNVTENLEWKVSWISAGLCLRYYPKKETKKPKIEEKIFKIDSIYVQINFEPKNPIKIGIEYVDEYTIETKDSIIKQIVYNRTDTVFLYKPKKIEASLELFAVDSIGNFVKNPKIKVEEYIATRLEPLLNYIFFDEGSDKIPERYVMLEKSDLKQFNLDSLNKSTTLDIYYNLLNIIGKRLAEKPNAKITLVGCNSNIGIEQNNLNLSKRRAENVKSYLENVWGINPNRIQIVYKNLPDKSSTPIDDSLKAEENRRVEIISDDWEILQPVEITTIERKASVDKVGYRGNVSSDTSISRVEVKVFVGSESRNLISHYEGTESKPFKIIDINNFLQRNNWSDLRIYGFLTARDVLGNGSGAKDSITNFELVSFVKPKENVEGMYQIDRFRLILFDFDKWTIEGNNKRIVNYIKSRIPENSTVTIYGSTDITGDESYNKVLSQNRADAVQKALGVKNSKSIGLGKEKQEFPNSLPEGRFYSRNVVVVVKKQIK